VTKKVTFILCDFNSVLIVRNFKAGVHIAFVMQKVELSSAYYLAASIYQPFLKINSE